MPILPDLTAQPRPTPRAVGGVSELPSRTGFEMVPAQQTGATGHDLTTLGETLQKQLDETEIDAANTAYDEQRRQILFGPDGFYTKKGKDALNAMHPTSQSVERLRGQIRDGLANPEQKRLYDYISRRSTQMDLRSMSMHAITEGNKYALDTNTSALTNEVNNSATYWNDPEHFGNSMGKIAGLVEQQAKLKGETDPESIKATITHWQSAAWQARIRGVAAQDPHAAKDLFDENAENIDAPHRAQLDTYLTTKVAISDRAKEVEDARIAREAEKEEKKRTDAVYQGLASKFATGKMTTADIVNSGLPGPTQFHLLNELQTQLRRNKEESDTKRNQRMTQQMFSDIVDGKITDAAPILHAAINGSIDPSHTGTLLSWLEKSSQPGGLKYGHMIDQASKQATRILNADMAVFDKSKVPEAVLAFTFELADRVAAAEKEGKNPRFLVDPSKPEYIVRPDILKQYLPRRATDLSTAAREKLPKVKNDAEYDALSPGTTFVDPNGSVRTKPGAVTGTPKGGA